MLTLNNWLKIFFSNKISFETFLKRAKVKNHKHELYKLNDLIGNKINKKDAKMLYDIVVTNKETYLTNVYNLSLKIPEDLSMDNIPLTFSNIKNSKFKNIIRNSYYRDILQYTKSSSTNNRTYMDVLIDLFKHYTLDYIFLTPSVLELIRQNKFGSVMTGIYFRASIMNPFLVYSLSKKELVKKKNSKILTPTLGWSSYMVGFFQDDNVSEYVGIDVIPKVCNKTLKLSENLYPNKDISIYCKPSEDLFFDKNFKNKYKNYFDVIFFSPPYFTLELYKGGTQSTNRYKTYEEWLDKYWNTTMKLCKYSISKNGLLSYIISNYQDKNLEKDLYKITLDNGFKLKKKLYVEGTNVDYTKHRKYKETIFIFKN